MKCRKLLAILLALVMVIGLLPFAALAEEVPGSSPGDEVSDKIVADQNDPLPEGDPLGTDPEGEPQDEPLPEGDPLGEQPPEVSLLNDEHHAGATALKSTHSALSDGSYYLSEDVELNKPVTFSGTATLCLNGHKLSCGSNMVITVDGTLTICDCTGGGKIEATNKNAFYAINVESSKTLNVEGGTICGGFRGISGSSNSKINISGGTIQKSASSTYKALELTGTTATITGGTITGGVELMRSSELSLGGNPAVDTIKLTHTSCSINATAASKAYSGGPIRIDYGNLDYYRDGTAIVSGVTEENAESFIVTPPEGMVVKFENGNLFFGEPESEPGHSHDGDGASVTWRELTAQDRQLTGGHYYLGNDITVSETTDHISITGDVTLCLNSHALTSTVAQTSFIYVENGGSLTLCDCGDGGKVESLCNSNCRVIFVREGGSCTIESGMISGIGIDDKLNGQTIKVDSGGFLTLNGGTVTGSTGIYNQGTTTVSGGTVACDKYGIHVGGNLGVVNMESGSVSATGTGSDKVSGIYMNYGSLVMTGGTVSGTTYGIELQTAVDNKSFVISGGTITGGYGIYFNSEKCKSPLYLTGDPTLSTLHLSKPTTLIFASKGGSPYSGGEITVSLGSGDRESAVIISGISNNADKFTYAGEDFELAEDGKGNLILQVPTTAPGHANHGVDGTDTDPQTWQVWNPQTTPTISQNGYYYLDENFEFIDQKITIDADVYLCLNGKTLASTADYAVEVKEGHALTICDCGEGGSIERTHESGFNGCAVLVRGDFTLYGGSLENHGSKGYGIFVTASGGGSRATIAGGSVSSDVNAIQVSTASNVTLSGGQVFGKKSGVVLANDDISFTMTGGSVTAEIERGITTNNYDITLSIFDGTIHGGDAGIRLLTTSGGGTTISGGTITSEEGVGIDQKDLSGWGKGGQEATLILTGAPEIDSLRLEVADKVNGAEYDGEVLDVAFVKDDAADGDIVIVGTTDLTKFNLTAPKGKILVEQDGNLVLGVEAPVYEHYHGVDGTDTDPQTWQVWNPQTTPTISQNGYYYLDENFEFIDQKITIDADVYLCLNGKTLASTADYAVEVKEGHALTICDCGEGGSIERTHESGFNGCAVLVRGDFTLYGGSLENHGSKGYGIFVTASGGGSRATIAGGSVSSDVNAIQVSTASNVTLSGGQVFGKKSGVVLANDDISFTMTGGSVTAEIERGITTNNYDITLSIFDGTIHGGDAGIRLLTTSGGGTTISGGTITSEEGVGIDQKDLSGWGKGGQEATLILTGAPEIDSLRLEVADKVNGAEYDGEVLDVAFVKDDAADGDIVIVGTTDLTKFNLTAPADKALVASEGNLVLTSKPAGHQDHDANGTGNIPTGKKWNVWDGATQMDTAGYYYLEENITLTSTILVTKDVHLCLNGHKITVPDGSKVSAMFKIENSGKLSVCDCQEGGIIEMLRDGSNNMAIQVMSRRTFDLYSGTIYAAGSSRAVYSNGGTVNVSDGIVESASTVNGALRADGATAVVNLSGGEIQGRLQLRSGAKLYLSNAPTLGYVDIKAINESYPIEIHAASKDGTPYTGGAIEISTVETNLQPGHIVVYNVNENNYQLFTLKDNEIVREGDNLVIASDGTIELTVTPPDFTYGDPDAVIEVTTLPEDATLSFSLDRDSPTTLGTIDKNTGELTDFDAGTFTVTVTATKEGYTAASETVEFTVKKKDVTITPNTQQIDYSAEIAQGADQVTASGLVNGDILSEITLTADKSAKTITASNAVIKNGNRDVNKNYNIYYAPGTLSFSNVPQDELTITGQPETVTYGATFKLTATGGSGTGTVTWRATGEADVDDEGNVTITGTGDFTITATKAGDDTYAAATATYQGTAQKRALTITADDETIAFNAAAPAYTATVAGALPADEKAIAGAYTLSCGYAPGKAVGDYTITVTANLTPDLTAKYDLTTTNGTLHVTKAAAEVTTAPTARMDLVYTGTAQTLVTDGTATGGTMVYSLDGENYDEAVPTGINAGDYTVWYKVQGDGNYSDTAPVEIKVSIGKADLTVTADNKQIYEGSPVPTYTASYSGFVNNETKDVLSGELKFTCDYTTSSEPGTYDIKPSGLTSTNYNIEFENGTLTVVKVGEIHPPVARDLTYTGKLQELIVPAQAADDVDLFYSLDLQHFYRTIPEATDAGTYTVYWEAEKGGTTVDSGSLTVTIEKAPLTVKANDTWVYAGDTPAFTATITGYVNGEDWHELGGKLTFTCDYSEKYSKPGSRYTITPKGLKADNYDITFEDGILTVKDPLSPRFNVYVLDSKHGTVEADCRYARKGDVVTLTIKPDWGYELETLTVTDSHGYELKLTYHSNGTYTFTMPRDNVTVKAIFTVRDMPFVDVPGDAWYAGGVRYVYAHGLMNGTGSWRFSPNRTTTRAMIATILYRMEGSPRVYGTSQFGDVEAGSWYEDAVIWATQNDIVEGYTSKTFGPNDPITREQMAAMLYRYADYCRCDMSAGRYVDLSKFSDMNEISDYAIPALRWAVGEEIIQGRTGKRLAPTDTATRAEVAVMLMRFCEDVIW